MTVSIDKFIADLRAVATQPDAKQQVQNILRAMIADPEKLAAALPDYSENDTVLYEDDSLSVWHVRFIPGIAVPPHEHRIPAFIGVYLGQERNDFYQLTDGGKLINSGHQVLAPGDMLAMGVEAIHSVNCVSDEPCCGLHVYLGRLTTVERSLFHPQTHERIPYTEENYERLQQAI
ncbi:MAG: hypothetical protein ACPGSM_06750 [Thiolinea sp.]